MKLPHRQFLHLAAGAAALMAISCFAWAQTNPVPSKVGTRLIMFLMIFRPPPRAHRAQSSNLLTVNGTHYVIDAGDGVARRLAKAAINVRDIGTIFITHHHDDHTAGLGTLMSVAWDAQRKAPINVYGPPPTNALVKAAVQYYGISAEIRLADEGSGLTIPIEQVLFGHDVGTGVVYQDTNIKVTAVENSHFAFHGGQAAGKHKSYSYRFETPGRVVVFTGDTGPSDKVAELAQNADILVSEVGSADEVKQLLIKNGTWQNMSAEQQTDVMRHLTEEHLTPAEVGKLAARAKAGKVVLTHLLPSVNDNDDYARFIPEVRQFFSGDVVIAKDLMEF